MDDIEAESVRFLKNANPQNVAVEVADSLKPIRSTVLATTGRA